MRLRNDCRIELNCVTWGRAGRRLREHCQKASTDQINGSAKLDIGFTCNSEMFFLFIPRFLYYDQINQATAALLSAVKLLTSNVKCSHSTADWKNSCSVDIWTFRKVYHIEHDMVQFELLIVHSARQAWRHSKSLPFVQRDVTLCLRAAGAFSLLAFPLGSGKLVSKETELRSSRKRSLRLFCTYLST
jgi:hypothetical protein